jgi:hypothetical protein
MGLNKYGIGYDYIIMGLYYYGIGTVAQSKADCKV